MTFPWIISKFVDRAEVCGICKQWIGQGEPRMWNMQARVSAHNDCCGGQQMGDHYAAHVAEPVHESDAARGHRENMESGEKLRNVLAMLIVVLEQINAHLEKLAEAKP